MYLKMERDKNWQMTSQNHGIELSEMLAGQCTLYVEWKETKIYPLH